LQQAVEAAGVPDQAQVWVPAPIERAGAGVERADAGRRIVELAGDQEPRAGGEEGADVKPEQRPRAPAADAAAAARIERTQPRTVQPAEAREGAGNVQARPGTGQRLDADRSPARAPHRAPPRLIDGAATKQMGDPDIASIAEAGEAAAEEPAAATVGDRRLDDPVRRHPRALPPARGVEENDQATERSGHGRHAE
jgi:hypothetical protein